MSENKPIRYVFNSQEGYESAKKALDSNKIAYSDGSFNVYGTIMVQTDDSEHIDRIIGRQMAKDGVKGKFTNDSSPNTFDVPRDFGPNDELIANLEGLKQVLLNSMRYSRENFLDYLDSLPSNQADDLLATICGVDIDYAGTPEDYACNCDNLSDDESIYPDAAYESMKEFVKQCFANRYLGALISPIPDEYEVYVRFPYIDGLVDALDAIIEKRKSNI